MKKIFDVAYQSRFLSMRDTRIINAVCREHARFYHMLIERRSRRVVVAAAAAARAVAVLVVFLLRSLIIKMDQWVD